MPGRDGISAQRPFPQAGGISRCRLVPGHPHESGVRQSVRTPRELPAVLRSAVAEPAVRPRPCLDVGRAPDLAHGQHGNGLREVGPGDELLNALAAHAEHGRNLSSAHDVMHSQDATRHLTSSQYPGETSHVTRGVEPRGHGRCGNTGRGLDHHLPTQEETVSFIVNDGGQLEVGPPEDDPTRQRNSRLVQMIAFELEMRVQAQEVYDRQLMELGRRVAELEQFVLGPAAAPVMHHPFFGPEGGRDACTECALPEAVHVGWKPVAR